MPAQVNPGQFALGSPASRAAARALIESRRSELDLVEFYSCEEGMERPEIGEWESLRPGSMTRRCKIPAGMTFDEALIAARLPIIRTNGQHTRLQVDL